LGRYGEPWGTAGGRREGLPVEQTHSTPFGRSGSPDLRSSDKNGGRERRTPAGPLNRPWERNKARGRVVSNPPTAYRLLPAAIQLHPPILLSTHKTTAAVTNNSSAQKRVKPSVSRGPPDACT